VHAVATAPAVVVECAALEIAEWTPGRLHLRCRGQVDIAQIAETVRQPM